jgi:hypothetical protein
VVAGFEQLPNRLPARGRNDNGVAERLRPPRHFEGQALHRSISGLRVAIPKWKFDPQLIVVSSGSPGVYDRFCWADININRALEAFQDTAHIRSYLNARRE